MNIRISLAAACAFLLLAAGVAPAATPPSSRVKLLTSDIAVNADATATVNTHVEIYADNAAAALRIGQTAVSYNAAMQTLDVMEAYTLKKDGTKIPVDVSAIYDQLAPNAPQAPMFTDQHVKTIVFPQFEAGDTAVYTVRIRMIHPYFPGAFWYGDVFIPTEAYDEVRETLTAPTSLDLQVETHGLSADKRVDGANTVYSWHYSQPAPEQPQIYAVSPLVRLPHYFVTTFKDYAALGAAYAQGAAPKEAVTPPIQALADKITAGAADPRMQAEKIYEWVVAHIRYVGVELGTGAYVPHDAGTVLSNGYGDCKDHVTILAALLKAKGIDSEPVLINSGNDYDLMGVPTFASFNHVITYLPKFDVYLDSSAMVAPFGILPFPEYGKPVVFATSTGAHRGTIPVLPQGLAMLNQTTATALDASGRISGSTTITASGPYSVTLRLIALAAQVAGPEAAAQKILATMGYGADATGSLSGSSPTDPAPGFTETATFSAGNWEDKISGKTRFFLPGGMRLMGISGEGLAGPLDPSLLKPDKETPCYSGTASEDLSLSVPNSVRFSDVPDDVHVKTDHVRFDAHWSLSGGTMHVHRVFASTFTEPICTADMRAALAAAMKEIDDSYDVQLLLIPAGEPAQGQSAPAAAATDGDKTYQVTIPAPAQDPKLKAAFDDLEAALDKNDTVKAMGLLNDMLRQPNLPSDAMAIALATRGDIRAQGEDYDGAIADFTAALNARPGFAPVLSARGAAYFAKADMVRALADFEAALAADAGDKDALFGRANCHMELGAYDAAARDYGAAIAAGMKEANVYFLRAVAYGRLGQKDRAADDVAQAAKLGDRRAEMDFQSVMSTPAASAPSPAAAPPPASSAPSTSIVLQSAAPPPPPIQAPRAASRHSATNYPPLSVRLGEQGTVMVRFTIQPDGSVSDPAVVKSCGFPMLDEAALTAVKAWRYNPALQDGKPVPVKWSANVLWRLNTLDAGSAPPPAGG